MPSTFPSGSIFPIDSMAWVLCYAAQTFPMTWLIDAARGVILRWSELRLNGLVLRAMGVVAFALAAAKFRKRLS